MTTDRTPVIAVSRRGADRIRAGHVWVYRSDVVEAEGVPPGAVVLVQEAHSSAPGRNAGKSARATWPLSDKNVRPTRAGATRTLGAAFYSTASEIAIRMISPSAGRAPSVGRAPSPAANIDQLLRERIRSAIAYRERFVHD